MGLQTGIVDSPAVREVCESCTLVTFGITEMQLHHSGLKSRIRGQRTLRPGKGLELKLISLIFPISDLFLYFMYVVIPKIICVVQLLPLPLNAHRNFHHSTWRAKNLELMFWLDCKIVTTLVQVSGCSWSVRSTRSAAVR